jgi:hypothetical protein
LSLDLPDLNIKQLSVLLYASQNSLLYASQNSKLATFATSIAIKQKQWRYPQVTG